MKALAAIVEGLPEIVVHGPTTAPVRGICLDSRRVEHAFLFAALEGAKADGRKFVAQAVRNGASAVLSAPPRPSGISENTTWIESDAPRRTLAALSKNFFDRADEALSVVGITGTDGKTTTAQMLAAALGELSMKCAVCGTLGETIDADWAQSALTTPEAPDLWSFLSRARDRGCEAAVVEVSSVALIADRVHGMAFDIAILTGIGHDHLDLHGDMDAYVAAKCMLFERLGSEGLAILPADDEHLATFREASSASVQTFGFSQEADWRVEDHRASRNGATFRLAGPAGAFNLSTPRPGRWDALNLAAGVAAAAHLGLDPKLCAEAIAEMPPIAGRFESIDRGQRFSAIVDYAHTPEAISRLLEAMRTVTPGRLILVFGCGGDRDREKRAPMGRAAARGADLVLLTDDNPRSEEPRAIADEILEGIDGTRDHVLRIADRREAIFAAVEAAQADDSVIIAGKGHETGQRFADRTIPFDDRSVLAAALDQRLCRDRRRAE